MHKQKITVIISALLFIAAGCKKSFLDTRPYDSVSSDPMWTSEGLTDKGVIGVYNALKQETVGYYAYKYFGALGMDMQYHGNKTMGFLTGSVTPNDFLSTQTWKEHYEGIHRANDAIYNIPLKSEAPEPKKKRLVAECKFLRAYFYYRLNVLFQGVPIYTKPTDNAHMTKPRSTVNEVWDQCISDLTDCINEPELPDNTLGSTLHGRASKGAAYALRGMIYMWEKKYGEAINDFVNVGKMGYSLYQGKWSDLFTVAHENNTEMILPLQFDAIGGYSSDIQKSVGARSNYDGWDECIPAPDYVDLFEWKDGSKFSWDEVIPGYSSIAPHKREVFFLRDSLDKNSPDVNLRNAYINAEKRIGSETMDKYYLKYGNEARVKAAYEDRDPRLKESVITPYSTYQCYNPFYYSGEVRTLTMRWPLISKEHPYDDFWPDKRESGFYIFKKYNEEGKTDLVDRDHCAVDFPLIRYTYIKLLLAEAYNESGDLPDAIKAVNAVRERAGMPDLVAGGSGPNGVEGKDDMRERIRYEDRVEFALEGVDFFNELRWGTWKEVKFNQAKGRKSFWGAVTKAYSYRGDYIWPWPIPGREVEKNPNLKQNPGWIN